MFLKKEENEILTKPKRNRIFFTVVDFERKEKKNNLSAYIHEISSPKRLPTLFAK